MKHFLKRFMLFCTALLLILILGIAIPPTPRALQNLIFAKYRKDSLLVYCPSPRIIFVGGSNLSFGLNSKLIKDSLGLNPINTAISGFIGLSYMLETVKENIRATDIVVIAAEYQLFFGRNTYGGEELLRTVFEVSPNTINKLSINQWINVCYFLPKYSFSKFNPMEYLYPEVYPPYSVNSFNDFGDAYVHWDMAKRDCVPYKPILEKFNPDVIEELKAFKNYIVGKGAVLYMTFPGLQASSFEVFRDQIIRVNSELKKGGFVLLGSPERFKFADSLIFNAPYHLSKVGVDIRTQLLIEDLKNQGIKQ